MAFLGRDDYDDHTGDAYLDTVLSTISGRDDIQYIFHNFYLA